MRGCAGARSTQARTPLALHSPQPFAGLGFSRTLIALLSSNLFFFILSGPGGCNVWLSLARGFQLGGYQGWNQLHLPDQTSRRFGFGFGSRPQFPADEVLAGHLP